MKKTVLYISFLFFTWSCFEPDEVLPKIPAEIITVELNVLSNQVAYLDLNQLSETNLGSESNWQLRFQNDINSWSIYINPLRKAGIFNTKVTDFKTINSDYKTSEIIWSVDIPTSSGNYPAIGAWGDFDFANPKSYKNVYLITWEENNTEFLYKFQMLDATDSAYHIKFGPLSGDTSYTEWILKDPNFTHSYFNLKDKVTYKDQEPSKDKWNICFTYVSDSILKRTNLPFVPQANSNFGLFQALIINHNLNKIHIDTIGSFEQIDYFYARDLRYSSTDQLLTPFYEWNFLSQQAIMEDNITLIIKNNDRFFAIRPVSISNVGVQYIDIQLQIKQL